MQRRTLLPLGHLSCYHHQQEFLVTSFKRVYRQHRSFCNLVCSHQTRIVEIHTQTMKLLDSSARVTDQRKRHPDFSSFFATMDGLCFLHNVYGLFDSAGIPCIPNHWRLFIDRSSRSLKGAPASLWKQISTVAAREVKTWGCCKNYYST